MPGPVIDLEELEEEAELLEASHDAEASLQAKTRGKLARQAVKAAQASNHKASSRNIEKQERDRQALLYRAAGARYNAIARALGFSSEQTARAAVLRALERQKADTSEVMREMSNLRLQGAIHAIWQQVEKGNFLAIDRLIKVEERLAKLWGLDAEHYDKMQLIQQQNNTQTNNSLTVNINSSSGPENLEALTSGLNWDELKAAYAGIFKARHGITAPWAEESPELSKKLLDQAISGDYMQEYSSQDDFRYPTDNPNDPRNNPKGVLMLESGDLIDREDIVIDVSKTPRKRDYPLAKEFQE